MPFQNAQQGDQKNAQQEDQNAPQNAPQWLKDWEEMRSGIRRPRPPWERPLMTVEQLQYFTQSFGYERVVRGLSQQQPQADPVVPPHPEQPRG